MLKHKIWGMYHNKLLDIYSHRKGLTFRQYQGSRTGSLDSAICHAPRVLNLTDASQGYHVKKIDASTWLGWYTVPPIGKGWCRSAYIYADSWVQTKQRLRYSNMVGHQLTNDLTMTQHMWNNIKLGLHLVSPVHTPAGQLERFRVHFELDWNESRIDTICVCTNMMVVFGRIDRSWMYAGSRWMVGWRTDCVKIVMIDVSSHIWLSIWCDKWHVIDVLSYQHSHFGLHTCNWLRAYRRIRTLD